MKLPRKGNRPAVPLPNHVNLPPGVQRDVILESDPVFAVNARQLTSRKLSGKVTPSEFRASMQWLTMAALRRAGINLRDSCQLLEA